MYVCCTFLAFPNQNAQLKSYHMFAPEPSEVSSNQHSIDPIPQCTNRKYNMLHERLPMCKRIYLLSRKPTSNMFYSPEMSWGLL